MCAAKRGENEGRRRGSPAPDTRIPAFFLYGESEAETGDDFVHVEDIAARSSLYGWEIDRHVHQGLCQVLVVVEGGVDLRLDDVETTPSAPCVVVVPPGTVHAFRFRPGTLGHVLTFAERGLTRAATVRAISVNTAETSQSSRTARPEGELFTRFRALVEREHTRHRPIAWYAASLGVGESSLDRAARAVVGTTAFEVVQERLVLEARRRLIYIAAPVSRLAYELGFEDPAYFWRFFKRRTGLTPNAFRRMARARARSGTEASEVQA